MCARVQNYYKGLFVALTGQQFPVVQWLGMMACNADVRGSILSAVMFFFFFFYENLVFLARYDTLNDPCEGQRPCLERPSRRSIARAEGPVRTPLPTIHS